MLENLSRLFNQADEYDYAEGQQAYFRYNEVMRGFAAHYCFPLDRVTAAFCALSPNNDYFGNLRSLASVLDGLNRGVPVDDIIVSTYNHNKHRAIMYVKGLDQFESGKRGPKILAFYNNILRPYDNKYVTVDGHVVAAYRGRNLTMKQALVRNNREYVEIADAVKELAGRHYMLPHQAQAIIWFTRKRTLGIKYDAQLDLFGATDDVWKTSLSPDVIKPYGRRDNGEA